MILFCGIASEPPIALAIDSARGRGIDHMVFHQLNAEACDIELDHDRGRLSGHIWIDGRRCSLERIAGVYSRMISPPALPDDRTMPDARRARIAALYELLTAWQEMADCRVVSRVAAMASNGSKPYQIGLISRLFPVPPTLVTNDPDEARRFIEHHGRAIYKSISSVRSIVREVSPRDEPELGKIRALPTQFQRYIPGTNIRVHVVGTAIFATEIETPAVDYRYAGAEGEEITMRPLELPGDIADRCRELAALLDLPFCGIDLKRTDEGEYYCFEANPSPAYSYYQEQTGQPIADALIDYLIGTTEEHHAGQRG
jgi:hypothetical protein